MNIMSLFGTSTSSLSGFGAASSQAAGGLSSVTQTLTKVNQRVQADIDSTKAQLSSFGRLKSAVSSGQLSAQVLTKLSSSATSTDITKATADFFNAFNATITTAKAAAATANSAFASQNQNASQLSRDMRSALSSDRATRDAMRTLGLTVQSDGTLVHDTQKFANALKANPDSVRAALVKIGQQVDAASTKELATDGNVAGGLSKLNLNNAALAAQQKALSAVLHPSSNAQGSSTNQATTASSQIATNKGLATYRANL